MAELGDRREGVGAVGRDADLRPGLLIGFRRQLDVVEAVILAFVRKAVPGPRLLQDFERLGKALAALAIGHAIGLVGARKSAPPDPEDEPAMADLIDRRGLFGEPQRVAQRQDLNRGADLHALGACGDRAGQGQRGGAHRAFRRDMDLGQPHRIETPALGGIDLLEGDRKRVLVGHPGGALKLVEHAELERHNLPPSSPCTLGRSRPARCYAHAVSAPRKTRGTAKLKEETAARRVKKGAANPLANMAAVPPRARVRRKMCAGGETNLSAVRRLLGRLYRYNSLEAGW